ncbi:hypothetical protein NL676_008716 [Syzygium grande]|nr:hypothetical protein NL676_008716 [Syzygium grande]
MKEKIRKPVDLEKLGELPDFTEFINENFTRDLLDETKVPSSDGKLNSWSTSTRKDGESEKHLRLHFITKVRSSLVKGSKVQGEMGAPIYVILVDSSTGRVVQSGPLSMLVLMVTMIRGDFDEEAGKNWTREFFESNEIRGQEENMPLLTGNLFVILHKGIGKLGAITVNDISSWTRSGKFRLGVKIASACCKEIRVLEGTSNAFSVEDGDDPTTSSRANRDPQLQSSIASSLSDPISDLQDHHNGSHAATAASAADSFGEVNMDDLLKKIYSDDSPATADPSLFNHGGVSLPGGGGVGNGGDAGVGTTVDEVWKEIVAGSDRASGMLEEELTLEDFLIKSGAVREEDVRIGGGGGGEQGDTAGTRRGI